MKPINYANILKEAESPIFNMLASFISQRQAWQPLFAGDVVLTRLK